MPLCCMHEGTNLGLLINLFPQENISDYKYNVIIPFKYHKCELTKNHS